VDNGRRLRAGGGRVVAMSSDAATPPLHDPVMTEEDAAELVRGVLEVDDIVRGSVLFFLCAADRRPVTPVLVTDVPVTAPASPVLSRWFSHLGSMIEEHGSSIVFARARPGQSFVLDHDRAWHDAVVAGCAAAGIPLLAAYLVTTHAVVPFAPAVTRGRDGSPQGQAE
jgi:hypothetical protein